MRKKLHLASTHDVFMDWYRNQDTSPSGLHFAKHVEEFAITLSKAQYCCACGKRMKKGERAYRALVTWGGHMSECALRPHHTEPCIPNFEFIFTLGSDEVYTFSTWALNKAWVDTIGEPNVRTRDEAFSWSEWVGSYFVDNVHTWESFTIKEDGNVVREEHWDTYMERVGRGEALCQHINAPGVGSYTPEYIATLFTVSTETAGRWLGLDTTYRTIFRDDW